MYHRLAVEVTYMPTCVDVRADVTVYLVARYPSLRQLFRKGGCSLFIRSLLK